jgi:hypothetical protein
VTGPWTVEVTRTVRLALAASSDEEACGRGLDIAWDWCPEQAEGGDQGEASARVIRAGGRPGAVPR